MAMIIEFRTEDKDFLIELLSKSYLSYLIKHIQKAKLSPECEEYVLCDLSKHGAEELLGQLAFEANNCKNKQKSMRINEIADAFECEIYRI